MMDKKFLMRDVEVTYSDGSVRPTNINGTDAEIRKYFAIGRVFNVGSGENDKMVRVVKVKILR